MQCQTVNPKLVNSSLAAQLGVHFNEVKELQKKYTDIGRRLNTILTGETLSPKSVRISKDDPATYHIWRRDIAIDRAKIFSFICLVKGYDAVEGDSVNKYMLVSKYDLKEITGLLDSLRHGCDDVLTGIKDVTLSLDRLVERYVMETVFNEGLEEREWDKC